LALLAYLEQALTLAPHFWPAANSLAILYVQTVGVPADQNIYEDLMAGRTIKRAFVETATLTVCLARGHLCEVGATDQVYATTHHPYTALLLSATAEMRPQAPHTTVPPPMAMHGCPLQAICPVSEAPAVARRCPLASCRT